MKTKLPSFIVLSLGVAISAVIAGDAVFAQTDSGAKANIQYPVAELGNCASEAECKLYCNKPENSEACFSFAEKNGLMNKGEVQMAKKFVKNDIKGPGGCTTKDACESYCNDASHIDECVLFAEKNNFLPPQQLVEAKQVQAAIKRGVKPPACKGREQCDSYCQEPTHMEECISFGKEAGFIQGKELEDAERMLTAVRRGVKPPACGGKEQCDAYCGDPSHMEECMTFAMEAGFMQGKELEDGQKMLAAVKKGVKPPACRGREECDTYCGDAAHFEECTNFAIAAGFMSEKDAEMAKKTGGKGPGGCKGKEQCEAFCNNPANQEICFNFGRDNGMIPPEELQKMEQGKQQMQQVLTQAPQAVTDCLNSTIGSDTLQKLQSGGLPPRDIGDKMRTCFEKMGPPQGMRGGPGEGGNMSPGAGGQGQGPNFQGPGGCKTPEECKSLCESNPEACKNFGPGGSQGPGTEGFQPSMMPPGFAVPRDRQEGGGAPCKNPEECAKMFGGQAPEGMMKQGLEMLQKGPTEQQMQQFKTMMPQGVPTQGKEGKQFPQQINKPSQGFQVPMMPMQPGMQQQQGPGMQEPVGPSMPLQGFGGSQPGFQQPQGFTQPQGFQAPTGQQPQQQFTPPPSSGGSMTPPPSGTAPAPAPAPNGGSETSPPPPPTSVNPQNLLGQLQKAFSSFIIR